MSERSMFVGMDVHQHSIDLTVAESGHDGAVTHFASIGSDRAALDRAVATLRQRSGELYFVDEAGPCGFGLYRHLRQAGRPCAVVAPTQVPKTAADRVKTDRRDSRTVAIQLRAGALRPIDVPDEDDEAMRDLVRAREAARHTRRRARQRVNSFLLRHGRGYPCGKKHWGARHRRWLAEQSFERVAQRITLEEYIGAAEESDARLTRLTDQIVSVLEQWRWKEVVAAVQGLRGVSLIVAVTVVAEVGDLTRFAPRALMAFLGLVPSEHSSGARRRQGGITKTGNAHVRRVLAAAAHAYRATPALTHFVRQRQPHLPQPLRALASAGRPSCACAGASATSRPRASLRTRCAWRSRASAPASCSTSHAASPPRRRSRPPALSCGAAPAPRRLAPQGPAPPSPPRARTDTPNTSADHTDSPHQPICPRRGGLVPAGDSSMALRARGSCDPDARV